MSKRLETVEFALNNCIAMVNHMCRTYNNIDLDLSHAIKNNLLEAKAKLTSYRDSKLKKPKNPFA